MPQGASLLRRAPRAAQSLSANTIVFLGCIAAAFAGLGLAPSADKLVAIWPCAGVALAAFLLRGNPIWPGVFLANLLVTAFLGVPESTLLAVSLAATTGPSAVAWILNRMRFDPSLRSLRDVLQFVGASCLVAAVATPGLGIATLVAARTFTPSGAASLWAVWTMSQCLAALTITPFLLWLHAPDSAAKQSPYSITFAISTIVLMLVTAFCYAFSPPVGYPVLLVVMLIAVRYTQLEVSVAVLIAVVVALFEVMYRGSLSLPGTAPSLARVLDFLVFLGAGSLLLGALVAESRSKDALLLRANQDRLRQSENRFEDAFHAAAQGMAITGLDGCWLRVNTALCEMVGYSASELLAMDFQSITHPDDLANDRELQRAMLAGEIKSSQIEKRYIHRSGKAIVVQLSVSLVRDAKGVPLHYVVQVLDITHRKRVEELWRFGLDNAGDVMWDWDIATGTLAFSGKIQELLGCGSADVPKTADEWHALIHPDDVVRADPAAAELPPRPYASEYRIRCADGSYRWILSRGLVMARDRDDRALRAVGTIVNVTEMRRMQDQLHQSDKMAALGQLTGGVAHDVNNDLGIVVGSAEMILEEAEPGSQDEVLASRIVATVRRSSDLIRRLLAFSRQADIAPEPLELSGLLGGFIQTLARTLGSRIQSRLDVADDGVEHWVNLDRSLLESSLINLSVNARDAMPDGGLLTFSLQREPGLEDKGSTVLLTIADTGAGMDHAVLQRIFDPFFTTKSAGGGTGLGLAMVYGFIQQSGGRIDVESQPGAGTRFYLRFPAADAPAQKQTGAAGSEATGESARSVLLVDDNQMLRETLREQLSRLGCVVHEAANFQDAVTALHLYPEIDFIISDFDLGEGPNGLAVAQWARDNGYPVAGAIMSGHLAPSAAPPPDWRYLRKPVRLDDLRSLLPAAAPGLRTGARMPPARTVLVAEDNVEMRFITVEMLKRQGFDVVEAGTARDALQRIMGAPLVDLVLSDLGLPDMSGRELAKTIASLRPDLKVLLMSGNASRPLAADAEADGYSILQKPFNAEALKQFLAGALGGTAA
jgi:PAS domain S-box-containing protein